MRKRLFWWELAGFLWTCAAGTLLHFLSDWSGGTVIAAAFSGVNESTWEHMKLLYFPLLLFALVQSRFFKEYRGFWCVKLIGFLTGLALIPALFYTYNGAVGKSPDWLNITFFFVAAAVAFLTEGVLFKSNRLRCRRPWLAFAAVCLLGVLFILFTFAPPPLPLFRDPLTGTYGI